MTKCGQIPAFVDGGRRCNESAAPHAFYEPLPPGPPSGPPPTDNMTDGTAAVAASCVNWNRYFTVCKAAGSNPFRGSISFDNIGLAWVAIFQVETSNGNSNGLVTTAIKLAIKFTVKLKTYKIIAATTSSHASLAQLLQPSLAFCCKLQPMTAYRPTVQAMTD